MCTDALDLLRANSVPKRNRTRSSPGTKSAFLLFLEVFVDSFWARVVGSRYPSIPKHSRNASTTTVPTVRCRFSEERWGSRRFFNRGNLLAWLGQITIFWDKSHSRLPPLAVESRITSLSFAVMISNGYKASTAARKAGQKTPPD